MWPAEPPTPSLGGNDHVQQVAGKQMGVWKTIPRFLAAAPFFVMFCFPVQSEPRRAPLWLRSGLLIRGRPGYLSPSHHILANLKLPREPGSESGLHGG